MLVDIFAGIVELILDMRQVAARAAHQVGIALGADRQHHRLGLDRLAVVVSVMREIALLAVDRRDLGVVADVDLAVGGLLVPGAEDRLALARVEIAVASAAPAGWASP